MAASFDGVDSYIAVPDSVDINKEGQDLSISAWFQVDAFDTSWQALLAKGEGSNYRIARQGDTNFMAYAGGARDIRPDPAPAASPTNPGDGLWHNVVATTTNGGGVSLWVDGALVEDAGNVDQVAAITNTNSTDPPELWIGNNPGSPGREWEGGIDEVAIWGRVLSEGEIASIWNGGDGASIPQLAIPEPASGLLMAMGMLGLLAAGRTRRN